MKLSVHLVVPDASEAAAWYAQAFGAQERSRIPLPGGTVMVVEVDFGGAVVHVAQRVPRRGHRSPLTIGGTATVLQLNVDDVDAAWARAVRPERRSGTSSAERSGASATASSPTPSAIAGTSPSGCATSLTTSSWPRRRAPSAAEASGGASRSRPP